MQSAFIIITMAFMCGQDDCALNLHCTNWHYTHNDENVTESVTESLESDRELK